MKHSFRKLIGFSIVGITLWCFGTLSIAGHKMGHGGGDGDESVATGEFRDDSFDGVRSDGAGIYKDGEVCVSVAALSGNGFYQVRTIANSDPCKSQLRGEWRFLTFDLGANNEFDLDQDGTASSIEEAPARFIAKDVWVNNPDTTLVRILVLEIIDGDGRTSQEAAWELDYHQEAVVVVNPDGSRTISLESPAEADLCKVELVPRGRRVVRECIHQAIVNMPFEVSATD